MRIEYELTAEDWGAFAEHCARTSPELRRMAIRRVAFGVVTIAAVTAAVWAFTRWLPVIGGGVGCAVGAYWNWRKRLVANVRSAMLRQAGLCLNGRHVMEALPGGLHMKCDVTDATVAWVGVEDVIETPDHVFVMLGPAKGCPVPRNRIRAGDLGVLVNEIKRLRHSP